MLGDWAYEFSFKINTVYNKIRKIFGLQYWSLSKFLKSRVKDAISFINDFKKLALIQIEETDCDSVMIGHIHTPAIEKIENKNYYNTGDFCESCSYMIETIDGDIELHYI
jgi:UDP-2,3-diacylglucosamine pyrophosphatase LpxH